MKTLLSQQLAKKQGANGNNVLNGQNNCALPVDLHHHFVLQCLWRTTKMTKSANVFSLVILILFVVVGVFTLVSDGIFGANGVETTATISKIEKVYQGTATVHKVYVCYTVDGVDYVDVLLDAYDPSMQENGQISILYMPNNPTEISYPKMRWLPWLLLATGAIGIVGYFATNKAKTNHAP